MNNLDDSLSFARSTDPDTSHAAAASLLNTGLDALVFAVIAKSGERGATLDDLEDACPEVKVVSLSPRPARLEEKGLVYDTGERRLGRSGRLQRVLRAVEHGSTASLALPTGGKRKSRTAPAPQPVQWEAVAWQRRYAHKLPDGGMANWQWVTKEEYDARDKPWPDANYEWRELYATTPSEG